MCLDCSMLFDRFIFVLYILFCYNWFLLGYLYDVWVAYVPIISLTCTMVSISIISLLQLQTVVRQDALKQHEKWETIIWSCVNVAFSVLFLSDALEIANIIVIGLLAGILLTGIVTVVGTCACYVIMLNGREWAAHVHLTCISFWVMAQYMTIRLPSEELNYVSTVPVCLMFILRMVELFEEKSSLLSVTKEGIVWIICIILHVLCEIGLVSKIVFFWGSAITSTFLIVFNKYTSSILLAFSLPCVSFGLAIYITYKRCKGMSTHIIFTTITKLYDEWTKEPERIPLDIEIEYGGEDFEDRL